MRIALVDNSKVVNIIEADDLGFVPSSCTPIALDYLETCQIGQSYDATANPRFFGDIPIPPKAWTAYQFLQRFTAAERATMRSLAQTDENVADFLQLLQAAQEVVSDDPMTVAGMDYAVSVGIVTAERKTEILS